MKRESEDIPIVVSSSSHAPSPPPPPPLAGTHTVVTTGGPSLTLGVKVVSVLELATVAYSVLVGVRVGAHAAAIRGQVRPRVLL